MQDVGGGEGVDVRPRRIAIVGAENIEDFLGAFRSGEPGRNPRLDRRPVRPHQHFPRPGNEGGTHEQSKLARRRHVAGARRDQRGVAAAVSDRIDERRLGGAVLAEDVAGEILDLRPAAGKAPGLSGAGEPILVAQHAVDLLRRQARELFRRRSGAVKAQRRGFAGLRLARVETAIGVLGFEHGEDASDAIARQAEFGRLRLVATIIIIIIIIVPGNAERQHLAHRHVGELIVHPGRDPFRLRDPGDGPVGELDQPAADSDGVLGRQRGGAAHERHVDRHASPIDVFERPVLPPFRARQRPRPAIDLAHRLDILARVAEKALPSAGCSPGAAPSTQNSLISFLPSACLPAPPSAREALSRSVGRLETPAWIIGSMTRSGARKGNPRVA